MKSRTVARDQRRTSKNKPSHRPVRSASVQTLKTRILNDIAFETGVDPRLLRLALNEAESLAFTTPFPALFFPALAEEKARTLAAWCVRQKAIRPEVSLAE